ncbi:MAG: HAMP domain-containing protein [Clostridia bacterium]|nr:HAMP domain-containing protein [Clostridia bacterium]
MILTTVLLSTVLTVLFFNYTGSEVFAKQKAEELSPRAKFIAEMTAEYLQGHVGAQTFERAIGGMDYRIWDASVYVFDYQENLIAYSQNSNVSKDITVLKRYIKDVLSGKTVALPTSENEVGVLMGEPSFSYDGTAIAAVFLIKPLGEVRTAIGGLVAALAISMLMVVAIMMIPAYFTSKRMTRPLKQISGVALSMAKGDFTVRAEETGSVELSNLARSFNLLSDELSRTIGYLTYEKNKLLAVINGLGEGIIAADRDGNIIHSNKAAVTLLGGSEEKALSNIPAYSHIREAADKAFTGDEKQYTGEIKVRDKVLVYTITPLFDSENISRETVTLIRDVTESVRLEQTRKDYVANVSHELRTPIASIRSLADALNDGLIKTDEDRSRYYGYILRESIRLSHLINDLLELSRLQSGSVALSKSNFDIAELLYDVADRFANSAQEKGMSIEPKVSDEVIASPMVYSNPDRVEQILIILLDNAVKHGESGKIQLKADNKDNDVVLTVSNDGYIDENDIGHIFERFYKVDKSHSGNGTGLGLSIANETVRLLGGKIKAECEKGRVEMTVTLSKNEEE